MSAEASLSGGPEASSRPTRAELRRQREAGVVPSPAASPPAGAPPVAAPIAPIATAPSHAAPTDAAVVAVAPAGRAALREQRTPQQDNVLVNLLKAWWLYPLLALIALCVFLGWRSTQTPQVPPGVQVSTPAPEN